MFFSCSLCGRRAAVGILSSAAWGEVEVDGEVERACPTCREQYDDWETRLRESAAGPASG